MSDYHLDEIIARIIGRDAGLFLDLATYSIISEDNAGQYYPDYAYNHAIYRICSNHNPEPYLHISERRGGTHG